MAPDQAFNAHIPSHAPEGEPRPRNISPAPPIADAHAYSAALTELNIARKNLAIYPATHHQVQTSLEKAKAVLDHLLKKVATARIGIADIHLMVAEEVLEAGNPALTELATALKQHHVALLQVSTGVTKAELTQFLKKLSSAPENGISPLRSLSDRCHHIQIEFVNYRRFNLTREASITRPDSGKQEADGSGGIWHDFTSQLLCGLEAHSDASALLASTETMAPEALAELLNQHGPDMDAVSQSYEHILSAHLEPAVGSGDPSDSIQTETAEVLDNLNRLIHDLNPQLQRQFLEAAFQYCSGPDTPVWVEQFLGGLSETFVVDMIRQANDKGEEISPSLINLVQKIVTTFDDDVLAGLTPAIGNSDATRPCQIAEDPALSALFNREDYETFVIAEYDQVLKGFSDGDAENPLQKNSRFPLAEHLVTLEEPHLNHQIARVLLAFMNAASSTDVYGDYATKLMRLVPPLLNQGDFELVEKIYFAFERHEKQHRRPDKAQIAAQCRRRFAVTPLLEKSITAFQRCAGSASKASLGFFRMLGPVVVPYAMALLVKAPQDEPIDGLVRLLKLHPGDVQKAVVKHLKQTNAKEIGNIVRLIQISEAHQLSKELRPLLNHPDMAVRRQVLEGLVQLSEPWAVVHLRNWLKGSQEDATAAIEIAGRHQVMELVPDLCACLVRAYFRRTTVRRNIDIIQGLGHIGDPYALPILTKIVHSIWPLYPRLRRKMKQAVYQSLGGYPVQSSRPLVSFGLKSKDAQIRRICLDLLRNHR
jgi:hypothetical protein